MTSSDDRSRTQTGRRAEVDGTGLRIAIACGRFNDVITDRLLRGCRAGLRARGVADEDVTEVWAPGAFELPLVAKALAETGRFDAVITLGAVIRGGTPHFDYVCSAATDGLNRVALDTSTPIGFGLLTCDTEHQALDRAGIEGSQEDKGYEATTAALLTAQTLRKVKRHTP